MEIILPIIIVASFFVLSGIKVINQYQRGVVLTLGRFTGIRKPGLRVVIPVFQQMMRVDIRTTPMDIPKQEVITNDNVTINVDAVVYYRVVDAAKSVLENSNYVVSTSQTAQSALRDVAGRVSLDDLLSNRDEISAQVKKIVDEETDNWGVDIQSVKLQNIELPNDMKRAMAKQAEAEREKRANIINADGEKMASETLANAAEILARSPGALNLRTLNTIERISMEPSQKTMMLFPVELLNAVKAISENSKEDKK